MIQMLILLPEKYHDTDTFYTYHDNWYFVDTFDAIKITRNNNTGKLTWSDNTLRIRKIITQVEAEIVVISVSVSKSTEIT